MDKVEVIIIVSALSFAGVRLYQKYLKNGKGKSLTGSKGTAENSMFASSSKDDDYEPYSKK